MFTNGALHLHCEASKVKPKQSTMHLSGVSINDPKQITEFCTDLGPPSLSSIADAPTATTTSLSAATPSLTALVPQPVTLPEAAKPPLSLVGRLL